MAGTLFVVGTPIGNLGDFSLRGAETLSAVDFIAAEDTRVTAKLLARFEIRRPLVSYHEHNRRESGEKIIARLLAGESCALVTDAGMPAISDPGEALVRDARAAGIAVESVPGPVAIATALAISGMPCGRFCFEGFLSTNTSARRAHLLKLQNETRTLVFYEAPHKLPHTLRDLLDALGEREIALCRELTKLHEEVMRCTLTEALAHCAGVPPRGEYVLVVAGAEPVTPEPLSLQEAVAAARESVASGEAPAAAAKSAAKASGQSRGEIYRELTRKQA
ncbi:MAG: 16S rRNA (cytidine(1402)-2'-O)-methyltransferase [Oscillospiraceae bacterium]|jgi:16S rRNA (cytidine1402-2'-O)-methyltransferase|nr:16S rRNA (cytidine(1402)-2'-O)-methyltransferase [Oscillospiraceae bacterium]